ncbi:sensor domain-containing protein [Kutzneria viridogrisea]|uniref:histidine kinase n=1 Tax=Kutzneria viridogrisea TaxID=47990 RepID=A0ABR6BUE8_9PSEU|nr:signal transduction histidine kinase [Kutzneria viridogrisea]
MTTTATRPLTGRPALLGLALSLALLSQLGIAVFVFQVVSISLIPVWIGFPLLAGSIALCRYFTDLHRTISGTVLGQPIQRPYLPLPEGGWFGKIRTVFTDPATWRDLLWLIVNAVTGLVSGVTVVSFLAGSLFYLTFPFWWPLFHADDIDPMLLGVISMSTFGESFRAVPAGMVLVALWWWGAPKLLRANAHVAKSLLAPTERTRLALRVQELSESRAESVDTHAAELRRIERDLHDGAQARLVALGMSLGMAEEAVAGDPAAARELLAEARQSTSKALSELRDLVRGIHPPVLADRGLDGALRALALANPLPVEVTGELPGRPQAPVESAVYFAVAEALANMLKHSGATTGWIRMSYEDGRLGVSIGDDGKGGASITPGGGLHGIERRLAAFDGTLMVTSPVGGPTTLFVTLPCELLTGPQPAQ